jgi:hypothetical protein
MNSYLSARARRAPATTCFGACIGAVSAVLAFGSGCGLISSDVTNFTLELPDKEFTIDATSWQVDRVEAQTYLGTSCASAPTVCMTAARSACTTCSGTCNDMTSTCDLSMRVSLYQPVDLVNEQPELKSIDDQPVIKVTIDSVTYEVLTNTLNIATPELLIYVAPASVMDPSDPLARQVGTIAPIDAGMVTVNPLNMSFTLTGKAELVTMMNHFKTPFNVIVGTTLTVMDGDPIPSGRLDAVIHIRAHAGI